MRLAINCVVGPINNWQTRSGMNNHYPGCGLAIEFRNLTSALNADENRFDNNMHAMYYLPTAPHTQCRIVLLGALTDP